MTGAINNIPSLAGAAWLAAAPTQSVLGTITAGGFEARVVGGAVRNALLGLAITDIDIATTALPADVIRLARAARFQVIETGIDHGTVTVIADHRPYEVTTLRRDVSTDGRRATIAFSTDWAEDARRRDFTMNALYCAADGRVFDPLGGLADLRARRVRFIGEASERIREDYLRILRFFRFSAQYGEGALDAVGLAACTRERHGLISLSSERIRQELSRLLVARRAVSHVTAMRDHGILASVLAIAPRPTMLARVVEIEAGHGLQPDAMLRLAALAVAVPEDAARLEAALRLSREERSVLRLAAVPKAGLTEPPTPADYKALLYRRGAADYRRLLILSWSQCLPASTRDCTWSQALTLPDRWQAPRLSVDGADVLARGVPAGRRVGELLAALEAWWIGENFAPDRAAQLARLDDLIG